MNIEYKDGVITIKVPYAEGQEYPKSSTGKSRIVGGTSGFTGIPGAPAAVKVNLSVIEIIAKDKR